MSDDEALPEPQQRLPGAALTYWRLSLGLRAAIAVLIGAALEPAADDAGLPGWLPVTVPGAPAGWRDLHARFGVLPFPALFDDE